MASVRIIHAGRALTSAVAVKVYALALSIVGIATLVSVSHVMTNFMVVAHGGMPSISSFIIVALMNTKLLVQVAVVLGGISFGFLVRDAVHAISASAHRHAPLATGF